MKKVFLLFGIAAFSTASAQQNDLFDIQKHLQKKQAEEKKNITNGSVVLPFNNPFISIDPYLENKPLASYTLPNGDKVTISCLDNMPCVAPADMSQFNMPNVSNPQKFFESLALRKKMPGTIPNVSSPRAIISK